MRKLVADMAQIELPLVELPLVARLDHLRRARSGLAAHGVFLLASSLIFVVSATMTLVWCASMSAMHEMPMPGGWTMSMVWMRMPGQTWPGATASFLGMWMVMTVAMMLPSLMPTLWRYRQFVSAKRESPPGWLTTVVGVGYYSVWLAFGAAAFLLGVVLAAIEMQHPALARAVPISAGVVVMLAGTFQRSQWKARHLAYCREERWHGTASPALAGIAWRHGVRLGVHCSFSCLGAMATLLALGVMDLRAMILATAAVTIERLAPAGDRVARVTGALAIRGGILLIVRAAIFG